MSRPVADRLVAAGMGTLEAARTESLFARVGTGWGDGGQAWFVPGRVELLGKHTDYAGGRSLLCTVERGFCFLSRPLDAPELRIRDAMRGPDVRIPFREPPAAEPGSWTAYPQAVVSRLVRDFGIGQGAEVAFASDLPPASGLSSSTALSIGVFLALQDANRLNQSPAYRSALPDLSHVADYLGAVENGRSFGSFPGHPGVGTLGGSQDQTAILCSVAGGVVQFSFDPVRFERRLPFPAGQVLVIGSSGVVAEKSGGARAAYNSAAGGVAEILRRWRESTAGVTRTLAQALASSPDAPPRLRALVAGDPVLQARLEQFITESGTLVPAAGDALLRGDLAAFGAVVDRSHAGADRGLRNQVPETLHLARSARRLGAVAASAFGAGFGGSVWAMVPAAGAEPFRGAWQADYLAAFPERAPGAEFFTTPPGPPLVPL